MKTLFLDTEFTELTQSAELLSIALVDENDRWFYGVFSDIETCELSPWHQKYVVPFLPLSKEQLKRLPDNGTYITSNKQEITKSLLDWLNAYDQIEIWADVPAYDWILFAELFGGARSLPKQIHYIVRDLATLLVVNELDPNIDRFEFAYKGHPPLELIRHNALGDAMNTRDCFRKLMNL